jgi:hypothetical protein
MGITHGLKEGIQTWQWHRIRTKVYKHGNNTRLERRYTNMALRSNPVLLQCLYTFVQAVCYWHVCILSFKPCIIAMFVYLRSCPVSLPCLYTFALAVCHCHVCIPSVKPCVTRLERRYTNMAITHSLKEGIQTWQWHRILTKVYKHGNNTRLERRYTNMEIAHGLNESIQTWQ